MKKQLLIAAVIVAAVAGLIFATQGSQTTETYLPLEPENKLHTELYFDAERTWNSHLRAEAKDPIFINGEMVGSSSKIVLNWTPPNDIFNHYLVTTTNTKTGWTKTESGENSREGLTVTKLAPNEKYTFVVRACFDPSCTKWFITEKEVAFRTPQEFFQEASPDPAFSDPRYVTHEDYPQELDLNTMRFVDEDGTPLTQSELDSLKLNKLVLYRGAPKARFGQVTYRQDGGAFRTVVTQLINP